MIAHHEAAQEGIRVLSVLGFGGVSVVVSGGWFYVRNKIRRR